ncbi:hypothetical protein [Arthrobacter phage SWEP2]|uniref:Uncharacterized protein n=1 Tax=Arthrobacter phage SWEP2 TaxID=2945958 RepID=A0A9E7MHP4_9CAUD|nr:hypothetical protein [Arthrobacter phage SWEP2]
MGAPVEEAPDHVLDHLGQEVRVGDRIVYAVALGRSAALDVGEVLAIQWQKTETYGRPPELKLKVQGAGSSRPGHLYASYRRFVRIPAA